MSQEIDDAAVLAHMKARLAALQASVANFESFMGVRPIEVLPDGGPKPPRPRDGEELGPGAFHGLSISEAAKKFLEITKKKQKTRAICDAIQQGGIETGAKNFLSNVYTTLLRNKEFTRLGSYWALADWYPNRASAAAAKPIKRGRGRPKKHPRAQKPASTGTPSADNAIDLEGAA